MAFDIYRLDDEDYDEDEVYEYRENLLKLFANSPEGQACAQEDSGMAFWAQVLIDYGHSYTGSTIPLMTEDDVEELLTDVFPRKVSLSAPEDADEALPALIAFWEFLKREYKLANADEILSYLRSVKPAQFKKWMNDSSKFGMAKSFFTMAQSAGFDLSDEKESEAFVNLYNASRPLSAESDLSPTLEAGGQRKKDAAKAKRLRKIAKASRKRNRKRK